MSKFKIGDKVRVKDYKDITLNKWLTFGADMVNYCNRESIVSTVSSEGCELEFNSYLLFAEDWLELVEDTQTIDSQIQEYQDKIKELEQERDNLESLNWRPKSGEDIFALVIDEYGMKLKENGYDIYLSVDNPFIYRTKSDALELKQKLIECATEFQREKYPARGF